MQGQPVTSSVMPGFMPGIHVLLMCGKQDVDGRDKPGHDEEGWWHIVSVNDGGELVMPRSTWRTSAFRAGFAL